MAQPMAGLTKQKRSYRQNCALAIALDLIGDRWTLLIVRELLIAPRQFTQLLANLPGLGTNLLSDRLSQLAADNIVQRDAGQGHPVYRLSDKGRALETTVYALIHWGMTYTERRHADHYHADEWDLLPLRSAFNPATGRLWRGSYRFILGDSNLLLACEQGSLILAKPGNPVVAEINLPSEVALDIFNGQADWRAALRDGRINWKGTLEDVELFFQSFAASSD